MHPVPMVGDRVVRGPDWEYGEDDGGDGCVGSVISVKRERDLLDSSVPTRVIFNVKFVTVAWDMGHVGDYRTGQDGKYDLALLDVGVGRPHLLAECDECKKNPVATRWLCTVCPTYDLCNECYNQNKHNLDHQFARFVSPIGSFVRAPTRESSLNVRLEARGLFAGAKVSKDGKQGTVTVGVNFEDGHEFGAVRVLWDGEEETTVHIRTAHGAIDIKCEEAAKFGLYYKDHLANLGERNFNSVGDLASVLLDVEEVKRLQEGHGDWIDPMFDSLRQVAIIVAITYKGDCKLHYPALSLEWDYNTEAVTRVEEYGIGDTVRLIDDEERVKMIQPGHGDWHDEMRQDLGQEGTVLMVEQAGDIKVLVNGHPLTLHPACLTLVRAEERRNQTEWEEAQQLIILKAMQDELILGRVGSEMSAINSMKESIVKFVQNAFQGNLSDVKQALEANPSWVNIQVGKKTALHVASNAGHLDIVKYLLSKGADLEAKDDKGFRPIHCAIMSRKPKVLEYLLSQGAYPSATNNIGFSSLHIAGTSASVECAFIVLKHGCNVNIQDGSGNVALHAAIVSECQEIQRLLIESRMIDLSLRNQSGYNALHFAALRDADYALNLILERAPYLGPIQKEDGLNALHIAALANNPSIARILVQKGRCNIDAVTKRRTTALHLAVAKGFTDVVEVLVSHGADINVQTVEGQTCMHDILYVIADPDNEAEDSLTLRKIRASMREIGVSSPAGALACYLVRNGGRLDIPNKEGTTPMDLVTDPKLRECLEKCQQMSSAQRSPAPPPKKERNALLSRILPFLNKDRGVTKKPSTPVKLDALSEVKYFEDEETVAFSINPFETGGSSELPKSPLEDFNINEMNPDQVVTDEDLHAKVEKAVEHACSVCEEQLIQLVGFPCQHVQPWPDEDASPAAAVTTQKEPPKRVVSVLRRQNSEFRVALACTVCFMRKKAVVFECGHSTCKECAELLPDCPVCRKPSSRVLPLYL